jgi:hypothetical protein
VTNPYSQPFSLAFVVLVIVVALFSPYSWSQIGRTILYILLGMAFVWGLVALLGWASRPRR